MPVPNTMATLQDEERTSRDAIILIDDETLLQDCLVEAMRGAFPHALVLGIPTIEELPQPDGISVALVLLKVKPHRVARDGLVGDIRTIARHFPRTPVVAITACDDAAHVRMAIAAGVQGVIPVTVSLKIAVAALQLVMAGGTYYPRPTTNGALPLHDMPALAQAAAMQPSLPVRSSTESLRASAGFARQAPEAGDPRNGDTTSLTSPFTAREVDVLAALQMGRSNKWIAHHLNLSENTVKVHIRHIMRKLRATNRTEAVILSQQLVPDLGGK